MRPPSALTTSGSPHPAGIDDGSGSSGSLACQRRATARLMSRTASRTTHGTANLPALLTRGHPDPVTHSGRNTTGGPGMSPPRASTHPRVADLPRPSHHNPSPRAPRQPRSRLYPSRLHSPELTLEVLDLVADPGGDLELQLSGGHVHLLGELLDERDEVAARRAAACCQVSQRRRLAAGPGHPSPRH